MNQPSLALGLSGLDLVGPLSTSRNSHDVSGDPSPLDLELMQTAPTSTSTSSSSSLSPQLVYQSNNTAIYRSHDIGIKVILDTPTNNNPSSSSSNNNNNDNNNKAQIIKIKQLLQHEQTISNFLPCSCHKRIVIMTENNIDNDNAIITSFNDRPALTFQWANGITLKKWLLQNNKVLEGGLNNNINNISRRLRAAMAIVKTLMDFHEGGVVYNSLTPENIVLELVNDEGGENNYVATFIDLSSALIYRDDGNGNGNGNSRNKKDRNNNNKGGDGVNIDVDVDVNIDQQVKENDLKSLGLILAQLFFQNNGQEDPITITGSSAVVGTTTTTTGSSDSDDLPKSFNDAIMGHNYNYNYRRTTKRGKQQTPHQGGQVVVEGIPLYLDSLISALLHVNLSTASSTTTTTTTTTTTSPYDLCYKSAKDVFLDLKVMAESDPKSCFRTKMTLDEFTSKSRLRLLQGDGEKFYGRTVQVSMLLHLFKSCVELGDDDNGPLMATISGYPGTGKSTLVNQIKKPLTNMNGYFIEGKFDKSSSRPDTVLASALNTFFGRILEKEASGINNGNVNNVNTNASASTLMMSMKWRIHEVIGPVNNNVMFEILPNLQQWMTDDRMTTEISITPNGSSNTVKGIGSSLRLKFMFCKLIGAIACKAHPLVLFLDDLQWADEMTLDIIRMIMTDPNIHHFLFLGCYRNDEVGISHPLTTKLNAIKEQGISILAINIGPIEKECVNALLSEVMCLPPSLCRSLSTVVHSRTGGIMLFVLRFLASLNDEGIIWFSMSARRWMYNLEEIGLKEIHGDVVSHMTEHMKNLSREMQMGLKVAACLGPKFDAKVLEKTKIGPKLGAKKALDETKQEDEFVEQESIDILESCAEFGFLQRHGSNQYKWAHDQIQQAAYELIPKQKRESFHLLLGSRLFIQTTPSEMEGMIFFIVDNMNRGSKLMNDLDQKYDLSRLNLEAGEKALAASAFHSAVKYLMKGLSLLGDESWETKYKLTMRLYDAASEALFVTGDFSRLYVLIDKPLRNARSFDDKLNVLNNSVRALAASSKFEEGIGDCVGILSQLGEVIPTDITADVYLYEVAQVKQLLHGKSQQELLSLPMMVETQKLAAMQFMNHALTMTFVAKPFMNPILVFRMVKMTLEHGICSISPFAFACFGAWLVSKPSSNDEEVVNAGHRMGCVGTDMMKRLNAVEMIPRIYATVYGFINIWKEPWQAGQMKHMEAYESGATSGDMEYALTNLIQYTSTAIYGCGDNLETLSTNIQAYGKRAFQCNRHAVWTTFGVLHQLTLDLMGIAQNAFLPYSSGMTESSCFAFCQDNNQISMCRFICLKKKYVAFFSGDLDYAADMYNLSQKFPMGFTGRLVSILVSTFVDGLIGFYFARKHREDEAKWTDIGLDAIQSLRNWVNSSDWNFTNKLYLLEAEYYFLRDHDEQAIDCYNASIKAARDHRFIHEEGLAEEKTATYLLKKNRHDKALEHLMNAKKCYEVWGAHALVQRIDKAVAVLLPLCTVTH